ncbi:MAG: type IX secretion system sortase PorU [Bacteroidia bacterium]
MTQYVTFQKGLPHLSIQIFPYQISSTGAIERLVSFEIQLIDDFSTKISHKQNKAISFANTSLLNQGDWYQFKTTSEGIYKLTYEQLTEAGLSLNNIDANTLKLYANEGGMLSDIIANQKPDDLREIPVELVDNNGNNKMDAGDYIRFYAQGADNWKYTKGQYVYEKNLFTDEAFVYLTHGGLPSKKISQLASGQGNSFDTSLSFFYQLVHHEQEDENVLHSGRYWFGDAFNFDITKSFDHTFVGVETSLPGYFEHRFLGRSIQNVSSLRIDVNGSNTYSNSVSSVGGGYEDTFGRLLSGIGSFNLSSNQVNILYKYSLVGEGNGWIDYYTLAVPVSLGIKSPTTIAKCKEAANYNVVKFLFEAGNYQIWDVSDFYNPKFQETYNEGNSRVSIKSTSSAPIHFVLLEPNNEKSATFVAVVKNQNLHAIQSADFIIITNSVFLTEANRLADFHRTHYGQSTVVVNHKDIYNEFSAGKQDPVAIRNFLKMIYDRGQLASKPLNHVLIFGDGSYDYKAKVEPNTNFVPTFQSRDVLIPEESYCADEFYGILDDMEGWYDINLRMEDIDVAVGRIPCRNAEQAKTAVDKIIHYHDVSSHGDWVNRLTFLGDDEDGNYHFNDCEKATEKVNAQQPNYNIEKIYLDAYEQLSFGSGEKYPDVNLAVTKSFEKGNLVFAYLGHGGGSGIAHERVVTREEIKNWQNYDALALMITATCELSRYDDPEQDSPGELMLFNEHGGAIGLLTTMRSVLFGVNSEMSDKIWDKNILEYPDRTIGDIYITAKNNSGGSINQRNFALLADPAMQLAIPKYKVVTTSINDSIVGVQQIDTFKAFDKIKISGEIRDQNNQLVSDYTGEVYPTVFDKFIDYQTRGNDPKSITATFKMQNGVLYRGKITVDSGKFSFVFVVPKDISYNFGQGKISYFSSNGITTGTGFDTGIIVGGTSSVTATDTSGPEIHLFMNDESWVFGGTTNPSPTILVKIFDENGINTVGNGIGRDLTAILDAGTEFEKIINLNDFYETKLNSYQEGEIRYLLADIEPGRHTLKVRVWDVYNNSSEDYTEFVVAKDDKLTIDNLLNYPNPFTTSTAFHFDHNKAGQNLTVLVQITSISGRIVKSFHENIVASQSHFSNIVWDGNDEFGDPLAKGVYLYKVTIKTEDGQKAEAIQKMVILK